MQLPPRRPARASSFGRGDRLDLQLWQSHRTARLGLPRRQEALLLGVIAEDEEHARGDRNRLPPSVSSRYSRKLLLRRPLERAPCRQHAITKEAMLLNAVRPPMSAATADLAGQFIGAYKCSATLADLRSR